MSTLKIAYIASDSRSGSTLLDLILGHVQGFFSAGEVRHIWERGYLNNELCGCQVPFHDCEFWSQVTREAFGGLEHAQSKARRYMNLGLPRTRNMPKMAVPIRSGRLTDGLAEFCEDLTALYRAIQSVSGARMIVDSSKVPVYGLILNQTPDVDLSVIHLVRDSRAVAYSWLRKKVRPEVHWKQDLMPQFSLFHSGRTWVLMNLFIEYLDRRQPRNVFVRYEDLTRDPREVLARIGMLLGTPGLENCLPGSGEPLDLGVNHTVSGNPVRFQAREIRLKTDAEWKHKMKPAQKAFIMAMTWPLLVKYGYLPEPPERAADPLSVRERLTHRP